MARQTVTVVGGDLFRLAQQYYGDATAWTLIAQANSLSDYVLIGQMTLIIPDYNATWTGGVPPQ
jgi:nucleoid-associated protein YgaU